MVVLVDEKDHSQPNRRFRQAPPIPNDIRNNSIAASVRSHSNNTHYNDYSDENGYPSRGASPYGNGHSNGNGNGHTNGHINGYGNGVARASAMDSLRQPASPRRAQSPLAYEQRTMRSGPSSVKDFGNHYQGSVDSFRI